MKLVISVALFITLSVHASDWPQFRGAGGQGHAEVRDVPTIWGAINVAWKKEIPGSGWSSPIIQGEKVFLTTAVATDDGKQSLRVLGLDAHSGKLLWNTELFSAIPQGGHQKNSHAS